MSRQHDLPEDIDSLKRLVREQQALLLSRDLEIEQLKLQLARLRRMQFGRSSEQLDAQIAQLELTLEDLEASEAALPLPSAVTPRIERVKPVRRPLPEHLPREEQVHRPACDCPQCGGEMKVLGEDVSEVLEYVPSRFKVIRHVRPKLTCASCQTIVQVPAPSRGMSTESHGLSRKTFGSALLATTLVPRWAIGSPFSRPPFPR